MGKCRPGASRKVPPPLNFRFIRERPFAVPSFHQKCPRLPCRGPGYQCEIRFVVPLTVTASLRLDSLLFRWNAVHVVWAVLTHFVNVCCLEYSLFLLERVFLHKYLHHSQNQSSLRCTSEWYLLWFLVTVFHKFFFYQHPHCFNFGWRTDLKRQSPTTRKNPSSSIMKTQYRKKTLVLTLVSGQGRYGVWVI